MAEWLTRAQIDQVIDGVSAADLLDHQGKELTDSQLAGAAFDSSAHRLGISNGSRATEHLRAADLKYMGTKFGEVINVDSPLSEGGSKPPESPDAGESVSET